MYRSVTESKSPRDGRRRAIHRLEGAAVALAIIVGMVYLLGWFGS